MDFRHYSNPKDCSEPEQARVVWNSYIFYEGSQMGAINLTKAMQAQRQCKRADDLDSRLYELVQEDYKDII